MTMRLDVVTHDAGELVRREHARDLGAGVVVALYRLMKLVQVHDLANQAFQRQLDATLELVHDYCLRAGLPVNVLFAGRAVFVSGQLLKGARGTYEAARELGALLEASGCAEITVLRDVTREDLLTFAEAFSAALRAGRHRAFRSPTARVQLRPVSAAARLRGLDVEALPLEARVVRTYASAVVVMRRFFAELAEGRYVLPRRIKRIAQVLVDLSAGGTPAYLGVTEVRNANHDDAGRAVNGAILAVAMAREITSDRGALAQIGMAALMHDVARPRAVSRAAASAELGHVAARLGEDAEDRLAAGTAAVLTALGRVNEPTVLRTVVAYEALALRRARTAGPVYRGARPPTLHARIVAVARRYNDLMTPEPGLPPVAREVAIAHLAIELDAPADRAVLRMLVAALGLLPSGTVVQLAGGEVAEVVARGRMRLVLDAAGGVVDGGPEIEVPREGPRAPARVVAVDGWTKAAGGAGPAREDRVVGPVANPSEPPVSALDALVGSVGSVGADAGAGAPSSSPPRASSPAPTGSSRPAPGAAGGTSPAPASTSSDLAAVQAPSGPASSLPAPSAAAPGSTSAAVSQPGGRRVRVVPRPGGPRAGPPRAPASSSADHGPRTAPSPALTAPAAPPRASASSPDLAPRARALSTPDVDDEGWSPPSTSAVISSDAPRASRPASVEFEPPPSGPPSYRAPMGTSPTDVADAFARSFEPRADVAAERTVIQTGASASAALSDAPPRPSQRAIPEPSARGTLAQTPLLHMLVYMLDRALSGSIAFFEPDGAEDTVIFENGTPVKVRTAQAVALLGQELVRREYISEETARKAAEGAQRLGLLVGEWLVGYDHITRAQLDTALRAQIASKISTLANLSPDTQFAFFKDVDLLDGWGGGDFEPTDALSLVLACARTWHDRARMHATLGRLGAQLLALHPQSVAHALESTPDERRVLDALVAQPRSLADLLAAQVADEESVSALVYTLAVTRQLDLPGQRGAPMVPVPRGDGAGVRLSFYGDRPSELPAPPVAVPPAGALPAVGESRPPPPDEDAEEVVRAERALQAMTDMRLAEGAVERGDLRAAEELARRAAGGDPERPEYGAYLAWVRAMASPGALAASIADLTALLDRVPHCERALLYRGRLHKRAGRPGHALADFEVLLSLNPTHREAQSEARALQGPRRR